MFNYSFWDDEAYMSGVASQLVHGKISLISAMQSPGIAYQKLYVLLVALFFKIFGLNEFVARLPSMIGFAAGIVLIFFLTKKLSNLYGGVLASFLYAFSHLNLAYATQAKPYTIIESILIAVLLLILNLISEKNTLKIVIYHSAIVVLTIFATLLHEIGIFLWIFYFIFIISNLKNIKINKYFIVLSTVLLVILISIASSAFSFFHNYSFFQYNNLYQVVKLFTYKYVLISVVALVSFIWLFKKNVLLCKSILFYTLILLFFASFEKYIFNIRYVLSLFPIIFLLFSVFWARVGHRCLPKKPWIIPLMVMAIIYLTGYKIVRKPQACYNPNIDKYGDVQIANYKDFYNQLKKRFSDYRNVFSINDTFDAEYWYFGRYSNAYFMKFVSKPYKHQVVNAMVYGSLADFKKIIKDHPKGILIMEDWQSFLPDDIKDYAKKNLKLEFRVESLNEAKNDPWPLALYSWGFN